MWFRVDWLVYAACETLPSIQARSSEDGGANIHVDMLLFAPLLTLLALAAIIAPSSCRPR